MKRSYLLSIAIISGALTPAYATEPQEKSKTIVRTMPDENVRKLLQATFLDAPPDITEALHEGLKALETDGHLPQILRFALRHRKPDGRDFVHERGYRFYATDPSLITNETFEIEREERPPSQLRYRFTMRAGQLSMEVVGVPAR
jgi:hypothetical protein